MNRDKAHPKTRLAFHHTVTILEKVRMVKKNARFGK
jgi:hypothetical protein